VGALLRIRILALVLLACFALAACSTPQATPSEPLAAFQPFLGRSLSYLARQVDGTGLLRASGEAGEEGTVQHWLTPDNQLALWAFDAARAGEAGTKLRAGLADFAPVRHGLIEAMHGEVVPWPPHTAQQSEVQPGVWAESYDGEEAIAQWEGDCTFGFIAALNAWNEQQAAEAQRLYAVAMTKFDGTGCARAQAAGSYATRDLALAILSGARIGRPADRALVDALLALQAPSGGFYAEYTAVGPSGATTTAATAYAALALMAVRQE
jgi:hypothetical protein